MSAPLPSPPKRGAVSNRSGRFEAIERLAFDDGWEPTDTAPPPLRTEVRREQVRTLLNYNASPDIPFDRAINPYRGCEHGCIYCFARPSHAYVGLSPGLDFESRLFAKPNAAAVLEQELRKKSYTPAIIALGANTDPYQPIERRERVTRQVLEVLARFKHPVTLITKSNMVLRDIDILSDMAAQRLVSVAVSITTLQRPLARCMEPRAASPERRLQTIGALADAGVPTEVLVAPVIPGLNDGCLETILQRAHAAGARHAGYILLRLPREVEGMFEEWLHQHFAERATHVLSLMRQCRDGKLYRPDFATRMRGTGPIAALIAQRFARTVRTLQFASGHAPLDASAFEVPPATGDQLTLF